MSLNTNVNREAATRVETQMRVAQYPSSKLSGMRSLLLKKGKSGKVDGQHLHKTDGPKKKQKNGL